MSDFFESVRALDRANTARQDLIALAGEIIFGDGTSDSMQRIIDLAWQARSRAGFSRADFEIEIAARRVESGIAVVLAGIAIRHDAEIGG